ncbi:non-hydrolyzing UDP-N-acetylglucosamine 2-epimerase [Bradyrhizobium erythrophlei]|uniref:non-hydrolyzing UDP-N-acetylglucosamine 2-epimerase n=1 Tax=Bradyrhizobium erythrophlei TaxID=1437360 RepID=UPI0035E5FD2B
MKVMSIFGTRPEMIKMWSTLKKLDEYNFDHVMVHTGQNFTPELRDFFFKDLKLRSPDYELDIDTSGYGPEVADVIRKSDALMEKEKPDVLLTLGDTYSGLSVLPAAHRGVKIFHMEAGLRAWDSRMPEQRNRILIDHVSNVLLPYNRYHRENLLREGIHPSKIIVTGNPTFEAMRAFAEDIDRSNILERLRLEPKNYILVTAHRSENVDDPANLANIFKALGMLSERLKREIIFPMHPRTTSKLKNVRVPEKVRIMAPLGFYDFNCLLKQSLCVLSDSGTAAEEGLFYKVPNVSLRMATERVETLESGATIVSGMEPENIVEAVTLAVSLPWSARYELEENYSPSSVVVNAIRTKITNFF